MKQSLDKVIRHMVAWAGGDPCQVQLPRVKRRLDIHSQRIGDLHVITVGPSPRSPHGHLESMVTQEDPLSDTVVLCGVIVTLHGSDATWLVMAGAGMMPLAGATVQIEAELRALTHRQVVLRGSCSPQGIVVQVLQPIEGVQ